MSKAKEAADKARQHQQEDKGKAREEVKPSTDERVAQGGREKDVKAAKVAAEHPSDERTQEGEAQKGDQSVRERGGGEGGDDLDDLLDDRGGEREHPESTRLEGGQPDLSQDPAGIDDPAKAEAKVPDRSAEEAERWKEARAGAEEPGAGKAARGDDQQQTQNTGIGDGDQSDPFEGVELSPSVGRNIREEQTFLLRDVDAQALADQEVVHLDARQEMSDGPRSGEEGGAPLAEPTDQKHAPDAPWPGPGKTLAASPTPSPEPGAEPSVQYEPPQDVRFEHKPEAAVGLAGPDADQQQERARAEAERAAVGMAATRRERSKSGETTEDLEKRQAEERRAKVHPALATAPMPEDGVPRDEGRQVQIKHMADKAIAAVGEVFRGIEDTPDPRRVQIALQDAARRVMSPEWWQLVEAHFKPAAKEG